jgi:hypothetical protein
MPSIRPVAAEERSGERKNVVEEAPGLYSSVVEGLALSSVTSLRM